MTKDHLLPSSPLPRDGRLEGQIAADYIYCSYDPARDCGICNPVDFHPYSPICYGADPFFSTWRLITPDERVHQVYLPFNSERFCSIFTPQNCACTNLYKYTRLLSLLKSIPHTPRVPITSLLVKLLKFASLYNHTSSRMATIIGSQLAQSSIRHFSAHRRRPDSRTARVVAMSYLISGVVLPFIPPAIESSRQKNSGFPDSNKCVHWWNSECMPCEDPRR